MVSVIPWQACPSGLSNTAAQQSDLPAERLIVATPCSVLEVAGTRPAVGPASLPDIPQGSSPESVPSPWYRTKCSQQPLAAPLHSCPLSLSALWK